jgi:ferritin-like metal-binding protein YciE
MSVTNPQELFVAMLSDVRQRTERAVKSFGVLGENAQDPIIKEALETKAALESNNLSSIDRCFKLIGQKPVSRNDSVKDVFVEDFRRELGEIQGPAAKGLFVLIKANHLTHLLISEYVALIAMADVSGHLGVGLLLESCLANKLAFVERTRRLIRHAIEIRHEIKLAA